VNPYAEISEQDVLSLASQATITDRGEYDYSNLGYALLGQLLAVNKQVSYATLLQKDVLDPLGMSQTYLMEPGNVDPDAPRGGERANQLAEAWEMQGFLPAAGLRSTPRDMAIYAQYLIDTGLPDFTWVYNEQTGAYWHDGQSFGFGATLTVDPSARTATFVVADTPHPVVDLGLALHAQAPDL
jgi:CubicO group peptidase (beta-lactamase class C family)